MQLQMRWLVCHYLMGLMIASSILVRMRCFADKFIKTFVNILFRFFFLELHIFAIFGVCLQFLVCLFWDLSTRIFEYLFLSSKSLSTPHYLCWGTTFLGETRRSFGFEWDPLFWYLFLLYVYWSQAWVMEDWVRQCVDFRLLWNHLRKCFLSQIGF